MPVPALIIFDCDGVLVDSEGLKTEIVARHLAKLGIVIAASTLIERFSGVPDREMYRALSLEAGVPVPPEHAEAVHAIKLSECASKGEALAMPGVHQCLDGVRGV